MVYTSEIIFNYLIFDVTLDLYLQIDVTICHSLIINR